MFEDGIYAANSEQDAETGGFNC
eukprot:SAG31_NODE_19926_length_588_cov_0.946830_2_plen_22_part_01